MGGFPSGQRGQTVNLLATLSKVRILLRPICQFNTEHSCNRIDIKHRGVEQLEARRAHNPEVTGSSPVPATSFFVKINSLYAQIAQLVEQRTENPRVAGSIPALGIFFILSLEGLFFMSEASFLF